MKKFLLSMLACMALAISGSQAAVIDCNETALHNKIAALNASCVDTPAGNKTIQFDFGSGDCAASPTVTTIDITANDDGGDVNDRDITCDGVTIDGENLIIFEQNSPWYEVTGVCSGNASKSCLFSETYCADNDWGTCVTDSTEDAGCPPSGGTGDDGTRLFTIDGADDVTLKNFTARYFEDNIFMENNVDGITISNVTFDRCGDDCISSRDGHNMTNVLIEDSILKRVCNKGIQLRDNSFIAGESHYSATIDNVDFQSCANCVWFEYGRYLVTGSQFTNDRDGTDFEFIAVRVGDEDREDWTAVLYIQDTTIDNGKYGLYVEGDADAISLGGNTIINNTAAGVTVCEDSKVLLENDTIYDNGVVAAGECSGSVLGGVSVHYDSGSGGTPYVDMGGGSTTIDGNTVSSSGGNWLYDNSTYDVLNTTSITVDAENNQWDNPCVNNASSLINNTGGGSVDADPTWCGFPISCTEAAFETKITAINACTNYTDAGCEPPNEKCASANTTDSGGSATCCSGEDTGTCDEGRSITFDCEDTTIYIDDDLNDGAFTSTTTILTCQNGTPCTGSDCWCEIRCEGGADDGERCDAEDPCASPGTCTDTTSDCTGQGFSGGDEVCAINLHTCNTTDGANDGCTALNTPYECCSDEDAGTCCPGTLGRFDRLLTADDVVIDGETNNVTFKLDPPCDARVGASACTEFENWAWFIRIDDVASDTTIRNLTFTHFWKGIQNEGDNTLIDNLTMDRGCDDVVDNYSTAQNQIVQNSTITNGCDKCASGRGHNLPDAGWLYPNYDTQWINNTIATCRSFVEFSEGRHYVEGNTFTLDSAWDVDFNFHYCFTVGDSNTASSNPIVYMKDNTCTDSWWGMRVQGTGTVVSLGGNIFEDALLSGLYIKDWASLVFENDIIRNNGGLNHTWEGGIHVSETPTHIDLGGGSTTIDGNTVSSSGGNWLYDNSTYDVLNTTSITVDAENNQWDNPCVNNASSLINNTGGGSIDADPTWCGFPIGCTEAALHTKIAAINACGNYSDAGCEPPIEKCASKGLTDSGELATCCIGVDAGTCDEGRKITFNCGAGSTIYLEDDQVTEKRCNGGNPTTGSVCTVDGDCTGGESPPCSLNTHACDVADTTTRADCTAANTPYQCCTGNDAWDCCDGDKNARELTASDVVIDGEDNITFELDPPCYARVGDLDTGCTEYENAAWLFRLDAADNVTMRNFTMNYFWGGIITWGDSTTVKDTVMTRNCDNSFVVWRSGGDYAENALFQNNIVNDGCDKCVTLDGHNLGSATANSELPYPEYSSRILNNTLNDCRVSLEIDEGRHYIEGNTIQNDGGVDWNVQTNNIGHSSTSTHYNPVVYIKSNIFDGLWYGLYIRSNDVSAAVVSLGGNEFKNMVYTGIAIKNDDTFLVLESDTIHNNGGGNFVDLEGGVAVGDTAYVDLGGGSTTIDGQTVASTGDNWLYNNTTDAWGAAIINLWNSGSSNIMAENNRWENPCIADPSDTIKNTGTGTIYYVPVDVVCAAAASQFIVGPCFVWHE